MNQVQRVKSFTIRLLRNEDRKQNREGGLKLRTTVGAM